MSTAITPQSQPTGIPTPAELGFDPAELRQKYAEERDKRLRADANDQYQEITGEHAHYNLDPYVKPFTRSALHEELEQKFAAYMGKARERMDIRINSQVLAQLMQ